MKNVKPTLLSFSLILLSVSGSIQAATLTLNNGAPVGDNQNSKTAGDQGGVFLDDVHLVQKLQHFARERIPERVVHARGTGAHGVFVANKAIPELTRAALFNEAGKETPVFVRFSTVVHPKGSPETLRDPRGFATKFYTEEGNWDLVGNNLPVFFIRDAIKFPDMVHSLKPSPITNVQDPNRFFDFFSHEPGATNMLTYVYQDLGTPASYREMDGFGVHAYKFINADGRMNYVKFHWKSRQGIRSLNAQQVAATQAKSFNHLTQDLYQSIEAGEYPQWDLYVKVLAPKDIAQLDYNPLDATKIWPDIDEVKVGTMTLNRVPDNFFNATEQSAFAPANLVPGIEPSEDRLLQGRIFSYADTQFYRLGVNHKQLAVNRPRAEVLSYNQNGAMNTSTVRSDINYQPNRDGVTEDTQYRYQQQPLHGRTQQAAINRQQNFKQAGELFRSLNAQEQNNLISNLAADLSQVRSDDIKHTILSFFYRADEDYGQRLTQAVNGNLRQVKTLAKQ
jgi:catalase